MKTIVTILFIAGVAIFAHCGDFTAQEQEALKKHMIVEVFEPGQHSGHTLERTTGNVTPAIIFIFGIEDVEAARKEGMTLKRDYVNADVAQQQLLISARKRYHGDPFFTKCYMKEATEAYNAAQ